VSRWTENPKGRSRQKLETLNKNSYPDRLKNPQGRSMQKSRIKRQSNCIQSGIVNLGHPVIRRLPIRSICKSKQIKDPEQGQFKVVRENSGYCVQCTLLIYLTFSKFFKICGVMRLAGNHSIHQI